MITVSSEVAGKIVDLPAVAGSVVRAGDIIAQLDDRDARLALQAMSLDLEALEAQIAREKVRAQIAKARGGSRIEGSRSGLATAEAEAMTARARLVAVEADYARALTLKSSGLVTQAAMDRATASLEAARQAVISAEAAIGRSRAGIGEAEADAGEARVIAGNIDALTIEASALRQRIAGQKLTLERHSIVSPIGGVIDEVFADRGEHVAAGARIALAHAPDDAWIEANIKETDLAAVRVGAHVEIRMDAADGACDGRVERIGDAATSEFALIPNANPTGVFTKITQRVPVRIAAGAACTQLRPGAMATLRISAGP
jgi:membrane fusion protein (multidrug efflux system)